MTHPTNVRAAPQSAPHHAPPARPPAQPPVARGAWAEGRRRLHAAATTEPGRLRIIGAVLAALVVAFGAVTAFEVSARADAADDVVSRSQPLSADAASIYRSLADADTAASSGFLAGIEEPPNVAQRYDDDIALASRLLVKAATNTDSSSDSGRQIALLNEALPHYTGLIETARANNRLGRPLGGAYLRFANDQMSRELLPAAQKLYDAETARLEQDDDDARSWPVLSLAAGLVVLGALVWAQRRNYRSTNRVLNPGLVAGTAASAVLLLWLAVGHTVARAQLNDADLHGQQSLKVLGDARINSLKARANENLTVVARGAVLTNDGKSDKYETDYTAGMKELGDQLHRAQLLADDDEGRAPVRAAITAVSEWQERHEDVARTDRAGDYDGVLRKVIGAEKSTGESFDNVDAALKRALTHEQREFTAAAKDGRGALSGLPVGAVALGVLGAAGAVLGINRRLSEYR